jgi:hypothetical protein
LELAGFFRQESESTRNKTKNRQKRLQQTKTFHPWKQSPEFRDNIQHGRKYLQTIHLTGVEIHNIQGTPKTQ